MTDFSTNPAFAQIEDHLDAAGQKYRVQKIIRGLILFLATAVAASFIAALAAHLLGAGAMSKLILAAWLVAIVGGCAFLFLRPVLLRPKQLDVARLLESRIDGLHNGFTNSLLLSKADDLQQNPWLPGIFDEIAGNVAGKPLDDAIRISDLKPLALRSLMIVAPLVILAAIFPRPFAHGFQQMLAPSAFVPQVGSVEIVDVQPGDVTLVAGQPLEITVIAKGLNHAGRLVMDNNIVDLSPQPADGETRYAYRLDHVDQSMKYRVEIGGTQSRWFDVTAVKQVKLIELSLHITPPSYTKQAARGLALKADEINKTPIEVPEGSLIDIAMAIDVPVSGAMLQLAENAPTPMVVDNQGRRFTASGITITSDTPLAMLLMQGTSGQIIARLPEQTLIIRATKDTPPAITMKWPTQDVNVPPTQPIKIEANIKDDYGLSSASVLLSTSENPPLTPAFSQNFPDGSANADLSVPIELKPEQRRHGQSIRVQVQASDNRSLPGQSSQTMTSPVFEIRFRDPQQIAAEQKDQIDKLRAILSEMLKRQRSLHEQTIARPGAMADINKGQADLRALIQSTAETFPFEFETKIVQKTLQILALNPAKDAVDLSASYMTQPGEKEKVKLHADLQSRQRRIITTLESLLALLKTSPEPATQPTKQGGDLAAKAEQFKKLDEALKQFIKEEQRILDQTAALAKKPVDQFDDNDKKLLDDLKMAQEKLDAFMQERIADYSKNAEQDMSNAQLLKQLMEIYSETTMAKDALSKKAVETAVALEESGLELAQEMSTNIEKWLVDTPDRVKWTMEDPIEKSDTPMAQLPTELEDMIGELMEQQEDLFDDIEDANANWTDSLDKGLGWDAADGPIANMSAGGVTGNQLPNNNEMAGRSGEGRSGKSQGEFVQDSATGKGGRNTPTRLDPTAFQQGQIKDSSKDPTGGATGGGKISGQGGVGLEGPVPPQIKQAMQRLAQKQAEIRNTAERLDLKYRLDRYDGFKFLNSIALMRRVESDLNANRYDVALRRRDVLLDNLDTSHMLLGGRVNVQHDTTPTTSRKLQQDLNDAMKGELPPAWSDALKEYFKKLSAE